MEMIDLGLQPRTLADDILLSTPTNKPSDWAYLTYFARGFTATISHLHAMGGRIASHRSKLFTTVPRYRSWLRLFVWEPLNTTIPV
eukprot:7258499-Karenia_brevis.AAC.1